jgi:hypothetical protein
MRGMEHLSNEMPAMACVANISAQFLYQVEQACILRLSKAAKRREKPDLYTPKKPFGNALLLQGRTLRC